MMQVRVYFVQTNCEKYSEKYGSNEEKFRVVVAIASVVIYVPLLVEFWNTND